MSVRETLNKNPAITAIGVLLLLGVAAWFSYRSYQDTQLPPAPTKFYYTVDDGKTVFAGPMNKVPPFMQDGKEAVRAFVYSCDKGKTTFVGYLEKYKDDFKQKVGSDSPSTPASGEGTPSTAAAKPAAPVIGGPDAIFNRLVKRPGDGEWHAFATMEGQAAVNVACPSGDALQLLAMYPED